MTEMIRFFKDSSIFNIFSLSTIDIVPLTKNEFTYFPLLMVHGQHQY